MANSTLQDNGWGPQLLCSVFGFVPGHRRAGRRQGLPPRLPVQARHLLPVRTGGRFEGAARHRAGAAHPHHGRRRPPRGVGPVALVPHVGHARLVTAAEAPAPERLIAARGRGELPRPRRVRRRRTACARAGATLFRADGLGDLTEADFSVMRALGIRTVIDLRSAEELERGRYDVDAHPVTFHHFPIIEKLPDADAFDRQPGLLGTQYLDMVRDAGASFVVGARDPRRARLAAGRVPLHRRQGPHGRAVRDRPVAPRCGRAHRRRRLRAERRGHDPAAGQDHREVPRQPGDDREL